MAKGVKALDAETVMAICEDVANGVTLTKAAKARGFSASNVRYWILKDAELFEHSARARELGCDALADQCIEIADDTEIDPANKRIMVDTRIRLIGKWSQRYSDKVTVENNTTVTHRYDLDNLPAAELDALERILANASGSAGGEGEAVASSVH
jgi:hypothetical protein